MFHSIFLLFYRILDILKWLFSKRLLFLNELTLSRWGSLDWNVRCVTPAGCAGRMRPRRHEEAHHLPRGKHTPFVPINIPLLNSNKIYENSFKI
jgi:hypothetical protein